MSSPQKLTENLPGLWRISRYFWPHARQYRGLMAASMGALAAEVVLRLMEPWPLKIVFDRLLGTGRGNRLRFLPDFQQLDPITLLTIAAVAVVAITGLRALASYWQLVGFAVSGCPGDTHELALRITCAAAGADATSEARANPRTDFTIAFMTSLPHG